MKVLNLLNSDNVNIAAEGGPFKIIEYIDDLSVGPYEATLKYYQSAQNVRKRQVYADIRNTPGGGIVTQSGAMQATIGHVKLTTDVKSPMDLLGKAFKSKATGESAIQPLYSGTGVLLTEPTYKHLWVIDVDSYGGLVLQDGAFYCCQESVERKVVMRKTLSGALFGNEGLFNTCLRGGGFAVLESHFPLEEMICIEIKGDEEVRIDGSYAFMWDDELTLTVEKSTKTLVGSAATGEGLVNVYRGSGRVWANFTCCTSIGGIGVHQP